MGRKHYGKRRTCYEQFLLFPQCFQKACFPGRQKVSVSGNGLKGGYVSIDLGNSLLNTERLVVSRPVFHPISVDLDNYLKNMLNTRYFGSIPEFQCIAFISLTHFYDGVKHLPSQFSFGK